MWISVNDRLPSNKALEKFKVKVRSGSVEIEVIESVVMGKSTSTGYRFIAGDWQTVTHWWDDSNEKVKK